MLQNPFPISPFLGSLPFSGSVLTLRGQESLMSNSVLSVVGAPSMLAPVLYFWGIQHKTEHRGVVIITESFLSELRTAT